MREAQPISSEEEEESSEYESEYESGSEEEEEEEEDEISEPEQWAGDEEAARQERAAHQERAASRSKQPSQANGARPQQPRQTSSRREINPDFQDVRNTGRWGTVSKREWYIVLGLAVAVVIGIVVVVVVLVTGDDDDSSPPPPPPAGPPPPTSAPTQAPTNAPVEAVLAALRTSIGGLPSLQQSLLTLPEDPAEYVDLFSDESQDPNVRGMSWVLYEDPMQPGPGNPELPVRYAASTLYYATGGPTWTNSENWLTGESICEWNGLFCDVQGRVDELDLSRNNLTMSLPNEIALFQNVGAFSVRRNAITGPIPAEALSDIPRLTILYIDNNQFTGTISSVLAQGSLSVFFSQNNNFTRSFFPSAFCDGNTLGLDKAGISCDVTTCLCCDPVQHCL